MNYSKYKLLERKPFKKSNFPRCMLSLTDATKKLKSPNLSTGRS